MIPFNNFNDIDLASNCPVCYTPSNTAKNHYMYIISAGKKTVNKAETERHDPAEQWLLLYTLSGEGSIEYMDRKYVLGPGDGCLIDYRQGFTKTGISSENDWEYMWFHITGNNFNAYYNQIAAQHKLFFSSSTGDELTGIIYQLAQITAQKPSPVSELLASTTIIRILTHLIVTNVEKKTDRKSMPAYIESIMEHINSGYTGHITLDSLAAEFNVSKFHLSREFKKYTGYSPNEYLISVRINRAKELLRRTGYSVGEISQMTGCGDVNHFIQLFKSREKTTPAAFRKHWQDI